MDNIEILIKTVIDSYKQNKCPKDEENLCAIGQIIETLSFEKLHIQYPEVIQFVKDYVQIYINKSSKTRFVHYMGPISQMNVMVEKGWYRKIDGKDIQPICKCLNREKKHEHDHCIVKTILKEKVIQNKRTYEKKKDPEIFAVDPKMKKQIRTINIKNLYHYISTILYILCTTSTTNKLEHRHFDNTPFSISYPVKTELNKFFAKEFDLLDQREEYMNRDRSGFKNFPLSKKR